MGSEYIKFSNKTTLIVMVILTLAIIIGFAQLKTEAQANSSLPIFDYTNSSFLYKFQVDDRTCVLAEDQDGRNGQSLVCWPTTQK